MNRQATAGIELLLACALILAPQVSAASTLERVRASNTLTLGYLADFAPFSAEQDGQVRGYAMALCARIADKVKAQPGLSAVQVHYQPVTMAEETSAVSSGKIDILCTPTPPTLERRKSVSFSVPIYTAGLSVVVRQDASATLLDVLNGQAAHSGPTWRATLNRGLANQTFAALTASVSESWIRQQMRMLGVVATLVTVDSNAAGLQLVADGKADALFAERRVLRNLLAKDYPTGNLMVLDRIFEYAPTAMTVARGDEDFRWLVDAGLSEMYRSGEIEQAYDHYLEGVNDASRQLFKIYAIP